MRMLTERNKNTSCRKRCFCFDLYLCSSYSYSYRYKVNSGKMLPVGGKTQLPKRNHNPKLTKENHKTSKYCCEAVACYKTHKPSSSDYFSFFIIF